MGLLLNVNDAPIFNCEILFSSHMRHLQTEGQRPEGEILVRKQENPEVVNYMRTKRLLKRLQIIKKQVALASLFLLERL